MKNFEMEPKNQTQEAVRVVKNPRRRFRMVVDLFSRMTMLADLVKRNEDQQKVLKIQASDRLIVAIDYSETDPDGVYSQLVSTLFPHENSRNLHLIEETPNRFERILHILKEEIFCLHDSSILCYGFGDSLTRTKKVKAMGDFSDFEELKRHYRNVTPSLQITNKKSFAPMIEEAIIVAKQRPLRCHYLIVLFDWPVMSKPELDATLAAIRKARDLPLSILSIAIGEGTADKMKKFCDDVRSFPNFKLIEYKEIMSDANKAEFTYKIKKTLNSQIELQHKKLGNTPR